MDELFKNSAYRILEQFIEFPATDFSVRGLARELKLSHATILNYINNLQKLNMIIKEKSTLYPTYFANVENKQYQFYKKNWLVFKIIDSGLVDYIQQMVLPSSIILFGSGAKGTITEKSDIDIFVESNDAKLELAKYEKKLNRKINLLFEQNINNLSKELRNNIINGVILYGFIKVKDGNNGK